MICETAKDGAKKNKLDRRVGGGGVKETGVMV